MNKKSPITRNLNELTMLNPRHREYLEKNRGIQTIEMLISLSTNQSFRQEILSILEITCEDFQAIINEARSLYTEEELAQFSQKIPVPSLGALDEANKTQKDDPEGNE